MQNGKKTSSRPVTARSSASSRRHRERYLIRAMAKQLDELIANHRDQSREVQLLKEEIEGLRRELSITMESIAELPFVSGTIH